MNRGKASTAATPDRRACGTLVGLLTFALFVGAALAFGQDRLASARKEFEQEKRKVLVEAAQHHLEVGVWCRDQGLVPQATAEFLRAVEVSEGRHPGAQKVLSLMRGLDERFWKDRLKHPSDGLLLAYEKRARTAYKEFQHDRLALARFAAKSGLADEAFAEYLAVVRGRDRPLQFDAKGLLVVEAGTLPADISARIRNEAISINDRQYVRDEFLARVPEVKVIYEAESAELRVRSQESVKEAEGLVVLAKALLPLLEADTGGRPTRRMNLYVFHERRAYESYLDRAGLSGHRAATGVADGGAFVALVCADGLGEEKLRGAALHELSHLFQYGVTPVVMPSWYAEGFAETYGGEGTFAWDGSTLRSGGSMARSRLDPLRAAEGFIPLQELLSADALELINRDSGRANRFYAEAWAFRRFLRAGAGKDMATKFALWETMCRGQALGAEVGKPNSRNFTPAAELFSRMFGSDLPALEKGFREYLDKL